MSCILLNFHPNIPSGADPGEVKWVNFHPHFSEPPSFFFFLIPQILTSNTSNRLWFYYIITKIHPPHFKILDPHLPISGKPLMGLSCIAAATHNQPTMSQDILSGSGTKLRWKARKTQKELNNTGLEFFQPLWI